MATTTSPSLAIKRSRFEPQPKISFMDRKYFFLLFSLAHLPLGIMMEQSRQFSTLHAALTFIVGLYILAKRRTAANVFYYTAYVVGIEVVWRANNAQIFWESGKYLTILMLLSL